MYTIRFAAGVVEDLRQCSAYYRSQILAAIDTHLTRQATIPSRRRKLLVNLIPPWEAVPPIWELRVGVYRVFYDVSEADRMVSVRAIRRKPRDKRTEDIL
jgi:mRNA-degrading endonuclease RelE of RelBE toxin-antitoxin system